jgi:hypothetical protein
VSPSKTLDRIRKAVKNCVLNRQIFRLMKEFKIQYISMGNGIIESEITGFHKNVARHSCAPERHLLDAASSTQIDTHYHDAVVAELVDAQR